MISSSISANTAELPEWQKTDLMKMHYTKTMEKVREEEKRNTFFLFEGLYDIFFVLTCFIKYILHPVQLPIKDT